MTELNDITPRKVKVFGPYSFSIGDTSSFGDYTNGGLFTQVKMPKYVDFVSEKKLVQVTDSILKTFGSRNHSMNH